jgi:laminin gamma 1
VQKLLSRYELGADGGNAQLQAAKHLLDQAQQMQADTDRVLAETQQNLARAQAAIESGELTLKDAQNTLNTLKEFDKLVGTSKASAEEALRKVEEIHNLVKEAELKTEQAEKALKGE